MKWLVFSVCLGLPSLLMAQISGDTLIFRVDTEWGVCGVGLRYPKGVRIRKSRILSNLNYSEFSTLEDSVLIVEFKIDRYGKLGSIELYETENQQALNEATRVLQSFNSWGTLRQDGLRLRTLGILVIDLRSE